MPQITINTKSMYNTYKQYLNCNKLKNRLRTKLNSKNGLKLNDSVIMLIKGHAPDNIGYYTNKNTAIYLNSLNSLKK